MTLKPSVLLKLPPFSFFIILPTVAPVHAKARTLKNLVLRSPLDAHGVCTSMAASTPAVKCPANSGCRGIVLRRYGVPCMEKPDWGNA